MEAYNLFLLACLVFKNVLLWTVLYLQNEAKVAYSLLTEIKMHNIKVVRFFSVKSSLRTVARETASQIALRNCSKELGGLRIYINSVVVQWLSRVWLFATSWTAAGQASLFLTIFQGLLKFMFESVMPSNSLILCHPLLLLPLIIPSIRVFSNESALHIRWPKYWNFSISPSKEYSGLISFGIDRFDLFAVQGTLKSLLQCHSLKESILQHSAVFMVQLSHLYMTTRETIASTKWIFVDQVISLLLICCLGLS